MHSVAHYHLPHSDFQCSLQRNTGYRYSPINNKHTAALFNCLSFSPKFTLHSHRLRPGSQLIHSSRSPPPKKTLPTTYKRGNHTVKSLQQSMVQTKWHPNRHILIDCIRGTRIRDCSLDGQALLERAVPAFSLHTPLPGAKPCPRHLSAKQMRERSQENATTYFYGFVVSLLCLPP